MIIGNCKISKVETANQELKDGETKCTTIAHISGTLTRELAETLCGRDGAAALFSRMSWLRSGPVSRDNEEGAVEVLIRNPKGDLCLPSCGVCNYKVNGMTEKVSFRVACERGSDLLFNFHNAYPGWMGDVEIRALQGSLFAEESEAEEHEPLFRGSQEEMAEAVGAK